MLALVFNQSVTRGSELRLLGFWEERKKGSKRRKEVKEERKKKKKGRQRRKEDKEERKKKRKEGRKKSIPKMNKV